MKSREVHLVARPTGEPAPSDFRMVTTDVPDPGSGQLLVRNDWMSVDPYMRNRMNDVKSYIPPFRLDAPMDGGAIGTVVASGVPGIEVGTTVLHDLGWREYALLKAGQARVVDTTLAPAETYLGPLGIPGLTAYVGLKEIAPVRPGDVVFISGAAGAVGLAACRVARHFGAAKIIGSAGGPEKARRLVEEFGYDAGIDYRAGSLGKRLHEAAPDGIDVYFDNVGGDHLQAAIGSMRDFGRIALCGAVAGYNAETPPPGPKNLALAVVRRLSLRGFIVTDHPELAPEYAALAADWVRDGSLRVPTTVLTGIDTAVDAFLGLLRGANTGKMLVRLNGEAN
ncbi:NADP-dependent oxidoreductase [Nocardia pseudovaccinii]|uniref:NADP-dependent oxidoreductase n=1 Tax=Nocardia pseudovaccinii TaxID=189540 RepID=UPI000A509820|nr:NADP-dependent oxidoreductase [Nocardia pseudovaccinii]